MSLNSKTHSLRIYISIFVHLEINYIGNVHFSLLIYSIYYELCKNKKPVQVYCILCCMQGVLLQRFLTICCISLLLDAMSHQSYLRWIGYLDLVDMYTSEILFLSWMSFWRLPRLPATLRDTAEGPHASYRILVCDKLIPHVDAIRL